MSMKISYLGPSGTFTEIALRQILADQPLCISNYYSARSVHQITDDIVLSPERSQQKVIQAVFDGMVDFGCVPIESTVAGSVTPTLDGLIDYPGIRIYAETVLPIRFSLAAKSSSVTQNFSTLYIYPIAQQQTRQWIEENLPGVKVIASSSNSQAAADAAKDPTAAAITTIFAAKQHSLSLITEDIIDDPRAETRFILCGKSEFLPPATGSDRTSLAFDLKNTSGSLSLAIAELGIRDIDLIRLESRPKRNDIEENKYWFFVDFNGHITQKIIQEAIVALKKRCSALYYFGSWAMAKPSGENPPQVEEEIAWLNRILDQAGSE